MRTYAAIIAAVFALAAHAASPSTYTVSTDPQGHRIIPAGLNPLLTLPGIATSNTPVANVLAYGARGGTNDDTAAIQAALDTHLPIQFPPGTFTTGMLILTNNASIQFNHTLLRLAPNTPDFFRAINIIDCTNVAILGDVTLDGDAAHQTNTNPNAGTAGLWIGGNSRDIFVESLVATNFTRDGLFIGENGTPNNVQILSATLRGNGRNGCSIISGTNIYIGRIYSEGAINAAPGDGIDIEPDLSTDLLGGIYLGSAVTINNAGNGLSILGSMSGTNWVHGNITIGNLLTSGNAGHGMKLVRCENVKVNGLDSMANGLNGVDVDGDVRNVWLQGASHDNGGDGVVYLNEAGDVRGVANVNFTGSVYNNSTYGCRMAGVAGKLFAANSFHGSASDLRAIRTQNYGVAVIFPATNCVIDLTYAIGNTVSDYQDTGVGTLVNDQNIWTFPNSGVASFNAGFQVANNQVGAFIGNGVGSTILQQTPANGFNLDNLVGPIIFSTVSNGGFAFFSSAWPDNGGTVAAISSNGMVINKSLTLTGVPTLITNAAPVDAATVKRWFPVTNAGAVYLLPSYQ